MNPREHLTPAEQAERALNPRKPLVIRLLQRRYVIPFTIILLLLAAPLIYRSMMLNGIPDLGDPFDVEAFGTVDLANSENARVEYEAASVAFVPLPSMAGVDTGVLLQTALDDGWDNASPVVRRWLDDNRSALEQWKLGTEKPDFVYVQPKDLTVATRLELIQSLREFARLAQLETSRLLAEGQPREAWSWADAAFRSSRHVGQHGCAIERLVGIAIHAMTVQNMIVPIADHPAVTEDLLREMLDRVQMNYTTTPPLSTMMKCEYLMVMNTVSDPATLHELLASSGARSVADETKRRLDHMLYVEPTLVRLVARQYTANILDQIDLPVPQRQRRGGPLGLFDRDPAKTYPPEWLPPAEIERLFRRSFVAQALVSGLTQVDIADLRERSNQRALELLLAARIYRLRHGDFPADAEALVAEGILESLPLDPFSTTGEPMKYRPAGDEAFAWSIGEDGTDERGAYLDAESGGDRQRDIGLIPGRERDDSVEAKKP